MNRKTRMFAVVTKITIAAVLLSFLFRKINAQDVYKTVLSMQNPLLYLMIGLIILAATFAFEAIRLHIILKPLKRISLWSLFKYSSTSWSLGLLMPTADIISLSYLLKKDGVGLGPGLVINFLNKAIMFATVSIFAILALLEIASPSYLLNTLSTLIALVLIITLLLSPPGRMLIRKLILGRHSEKFAGFSKTLNWYLLKKRHLLFLNACLTVPKFIIGSLLNYIMIIALNTNVPLIYAVYVTAILTLTQILPSPLRFVGIREGVFISVAIFFYSQVGVEATKAAGASLVALIASYTYAIMTILLLNHKALAMQKPPKSKKVAYP